jgi:deoxyribodipyrimidine photolyase
MDSKLVHQPWEAGLMNPYSAPIVNHAVEREESLLRYKAVSGR